MDREQIFWTIVAIVSIIGLVVTFVYMRRVGRDARESFRRIDTGADRMCREIDGMKTELDNARNKDRGFTAQHRVHGEAV